MHHAFERRMVAVTRTLLVLPLAWCLAGCGGTAVSATPAVAPTPIPAPTPTPAAPSNPVQAPAAKVFSNIQAQKGWNGYALLPAGYSICGACTPAGPQATWSMNQQVSSPSMSGSSTQTNIGGQTAFSDILWNNHLIGDFSSQGVPDQNHTVVSGLHNFTYDVYFYSTNIAASQALEFDINQFVDGKSYIWGHECRIAGGNQWDIWDNQNQTWIPTGVACNPTNNAWNHVIIQVQRTDQDQLLFQSITLNGQKSVINHSENPTSSGWFGVTINYQQDGNRNQEAYSVWLDNLTFSYY